MPDGTWNRLDTATNVYHLSNGRKAAVEARIVARISFQAAGSRLRRAFAQPALAALLVVPVGWAQDLVSLPELVEG